jgi:hypothetical protein
MRDGWRGGAHAPLRLSVARWRGDRSMSSVSSRVLSLALLSVVLEAPIAAQAEAIATKVSVHSVGPKTFRVRLAAGFVLPCDASSNTILFEGPISADSTIRITGPDGFVCVQQTYEDFPDVGWGLGFIAWGDCYGWGGKKNGPYCVRSSDGQIHVTLRSTPPR